MARPNLGALASRPNDTATISDTPFRQLAPLKDPDTGVKVTITDVQPAFWAKGTQGTTIQATNWQVADFANKCRVLGGGTLQGSPNNGACAIMKTNGSDNVDPYELEFWHPGDVICLHLVVFETDGSDIRIFIDDVPTTRQTISLTSAGTYFVLIESFNKATLTPYMKKVRVSMGRATFVQMVWNGPQRSPAPTLPKKMISVSGDSYGVGNYINTGIGNVFEGTWMHQLKAAGFEVVPLPQSGTGYVNNGSGNTTVTTALGPQNGSHFGSTSRMAALNAAYLKGVRDHLVYGGANDAGVANSIVQQAAKDYFAAIASQMPLMRVYVIGVQSAIYTSSDMAGTNTAIKNACAASPNVRIFIDQRAAIPPWITGTGSISDIKNDGNADWAVAPDKVHLTKEGAKWAGTRALEALGTARTSAV